MRKSLLVSCLFLTGILFAGCQQNELHLPEDIAAIDVYEWDSDELIKRIQDQVMIDELVKKLNRAKTASTADMDYPLPDYQLIFKTDDNKEVFQIGYYNELMKLGRKGRYLDVRADMIYQVDLQLPIY